MSLEITREIDLGESRFVLRAMRKALREREVDIGACFMVGDKAIHVFPNNRVELGDLEYLREDDDQDEADHESEDGMQNISYRERPTWETQYPEVLSLEQVLASLDFAFLSAGLGSLFFMTNLTLVPFADFDELRVAGVKVYEALYPGVRPTMTELNPTLMMMGQDLYELHYDDKNGISFD